MKYRNKVLLSVIAVFFLFSCNDSLLECENCSEIPGLSIKQLNSNNYSFVLKYPVGSGEGDLFEPHFELDLNIILKGNKIYFNDLNSGNISVIWDFECETFKSNNSFFYQGRELFSSLDSSFIDLQGNRLYACRIRGIWNKNYDNPMGDDLVMFLEKTGVKGMYISSVGESVFNDNFKEYVFSPIGNMYYLQNMSNVKIFY